MSCEQRNYFICGESSHDIAQLLSFWIELSVVNVDDCVLKNISFRDFQLHGVLQLSIQIHEIVIDDKVFFCWFLLAPCGHLGKEPIGINLKNLILLLYHFDFWIKDESELVVTLMATPFHVNDIDYRSLNTMFDLVNKCLVASVCSWKDKINLNLLHLALRLNLNYNNLSI